MSIDRYHTASLDKNMLAGIQQLEQELGVVLVAVAPDPAPAQLGDEALQRLQAMEQQTGKVLLAYSQ
jgi:hypothetical protein